VPSRSYHRPQGQRQGRQWQQWQHDPAQIPKFCKNVILSLRVLSVLSVPVSGRFTDSPYGFSDSRVTRITQITRLAWSTIRPPPHLNKYIFLNVSIRNRPALAVETPRCQSPVASRQSFIVVSSFHSLKCKSTSFRYPVWPVLVVSTDHKSSSNTNSPWPPEFCSPLPSPR
jgi:hypothetical protein